MDAPFLPAAAAQAVTSFLSVTNGLFATPIDRSSAPPGAGQRFPKSRRLLRGADFRQVYEEGFRLAFSCFAAFCWKSPDEDGPKIGFTAPRALGKAVRRNRMRRRIRETFRRRLVQLAPCWRIVVNVRKAAFDAPQEQLDREVAKVLHKCSE
jgi:ribonuclease P protein component